LQGDARGHFEELPAALGEMLGRLRARAGVA
jgi:hypothetical protein